MRKLYLLSNVNVDIIKQFLSDKYDVYSPAGYGGWVETVLDKSSDLYTTVYDDIMLCIEMNDVIRKCVSYDEAKAKTEELLGYAEKLAQDNAASRIWISTADVFPRRCVHNRDTYWEKKLEYDWYERLLVLCRTFQNTFILDVKECVDTVGREAFYSGKTWYMGGIPYSLCATKEICKKIESQISRVYEPELKCLAIDFDNTIWGGVIGEDGVDGLILSEHGEGAIYYNLQLQIKKAASQGIILLGLTKNNEEDVNAAFSHPDMVLKYDDFVMIKANWEEKSKNLLECVSRLNIGLESVAFLDDNPVERDRMKRALPQVEVIRFPEKIYELEKAFLNFANQRFNKMSVTQEDTEKTGMYKNEAARIRLRERTEDFEEYKRSLNIKIDFHLATDSEMDRAGQLFKKTNQFNLTGKRYTDQELSAIQSQGFLYVAVVQDRYGNYGLVCVAALTRMGDIVWLDNVVMSCRVMGRGVEDSIFLHLVSELKKKGITELKGKYIRTLKNRPVEHLLEKWNFKMVKNSGQEMSYVIGEEL